MSEQQSGMVALGALFRQLRGAYRLTQEEMAARTGMSQKKYSRIESGEIGDPGLADVVKIGNVFGLVPNALARVAGLWKPTDWPS